jgi:hypothetical protein
VPGTFHSLREGGAASSLASRPLSFPPSCEALVSTYLQACKMRYGKGCVRGDVVCVERRACGNRTPLAPLAGRGAGGEGARRHHVPALAESLTPTLSPLWRGNQKPPPAHCVDTNASQGGGKLSSAGAGVPSRATKARQSKRPPHHDHGKLFVSPASPSLFLRADSLPNHDCARFRLAHASTPRCRVTGALTSNRGRPG